MVEVMLSENEIRRWTDRGMKFLGVLSRTPAIRSLLEGGGYTEEDHQHGWALLLEILGYRRPAGATPGGEAGSIEQAAAMSALDEWDGPNFERTRAALDHHYPEQCAYLFDNLSAKNGAESIVAVNTFVDRVATLRDGTDPSRTASRDADRAATELLVRRRILDANEEQRLRGLVATAIRLAPSPQPSAPIDPGRRQTLALELRAWLRDWRETARVLVTRRDYQIQLGLASRRAPGDAANDDEEGDPLDPAPDAGSGTSTPHPNGPVGEAGE